MYTQTNVEQRNLIHQTLQFSVDEEWKEKIKFLDMFLRHTVGVLGRLVDSENMYGQDNI